MVKGLIANSRPLAGLSLAEPQTENTTLLFCSSPESYVRKSRSRGVSIEAASVMTQVVVFQDISMDMEGGAEHWVHRTKCSPKRYTYWYSTAKVNQGAKHWHG